MHERTASSGPLKILLVADGGVPVRFALLLRALGERGHQLHVGRMGQKLGRVDTLLADVEAEFPTVTSGRAPRRAEGDGWRWLAWTIRGLADLAHHSHPHYEQAPVLRRRIRRRVLDPLRNKIPLEPLARLLARKVGGRLVSRTDAAYAGRVIAAMRKLERAVPTSPVIDEYIRGLAPDVVVATGAVRNTSDEVDYLKSARRLGIPTGVCVSSWDNLTNKGLLKGGADRVFVWNDVQVREAEELHGIPPAQVVVTGAHTFDRWFELRPSRSREDFVGAIGLDPQRPFFVYLCSSRNTARKGEVEMVREWIAAMRGHPDPRLQRIGVVVRPHPNFDEVWHGVELGSENAVVWPISDVHHQVDADARAGFYDTLAYCAAAVGINTTAMIEAAILDKSVLTILVPKFAQETTLHFHHLLAENGGFLHVAASLDEHVEQLRAVLDEDAIGAERRRRFVASFVRPHGTDRAAAPILADAIEQLAAEKTVDRERETTGPLLRALLAAEARLTAAYERRHPSRRRAGRG